MRVLHIISGNDNGGGGKYVLNLSCKENNKFENYICCIGSGMLKDEAEKLQIKVVTFNSVSSFIKGISLYIQNNSINIVNFHGAKPFFTYILLKKKIKVSCTAIVHSDYRYDFLNNKFKHIFYTPLSKFGLKNFRYYICVSKNLKKLLDNNKFKGTKYAVSSGINLNNINIVQSKDEIRTSYSIKKNDFLFVMVARMHPIKNHKNLIYAFEKLKKDYDNIKLMLVGEGELYDELYELSRKLNLSDSVIFTGYKSNPLDYVNSADISMLTSFNEGGSPPIVVLESAAVKTPIICSQVGDLKDIIGSGNGYLMNPNSIEDIYIKMKLAYENKQSLYAMGENLYDLVRNRYSLDVMYETYFNIYSEILNNNK